MVLVLTDVVRIRADKFGDNRLRLVCGLKLIVMQHVHKVIEKIAPHDSIERYTQLVVEVIQGAAKLTSPYSVEIEGKTQSAKMAEAISSPGNVIKLLH